ncbi:MAG: hypothetical protein ACP5PT_07295 [Brevinematia bacterium]|jgi:hypothetical protein
MPTLRKFLIFPTMFCIQIILNSCYNTPITKDFQKIYGYWYLERIKYSNITIYPDNPMVIYIFTSNINSSSNYIGSIQEIYPTNTNTVSNLWNLNLDNNSLNIEIGSTNYSYTINFVSVDSTDINYIWLMEGTYSISNTNYYFFISNNIEIYILKKL